MGECSTFAHLTASSIQVSCGATQSRHSLLETAEDLEARCYMPQIIRSVSFWASKVTSSERVGDHAANLCPACVAVGAASSRFPKNNSPVSEATTRRF